MNASLPVPRSASLAAGLCAALLLLAGCAANDKIDPPAKLVKIRETVRVDKAWSANVGGAAPKLRLGLGVAVDGLRAFGAGHDGDVVAYGLTTGRKLWKTKTYVKIAGGPGAGEGLVVVGAQAIALAAQLALCDLWRCGRA